MFANVAFDPSGPLQALPEQSLGFRRKNSFKILSSDRLQQQFVPNTDLKIPAFKFKAKWAKFSWNFDAYIPCPASGFKALNDDKNVRSIRNFDFRYLVLNIFLF